MTDPLTPEPRPKGALTPPWLAVRLLHLTLRPDDAEFAIGDLEEEFLAVASSHGGRRARRWFWSHTWRVLAERFQRGPASAPAQPKDLRELMTHTLRDARLAFRSFTRRPLLSVAAILTLALGVGANAAVFSVAFPVLVSPLPLPDEDRLAIVMLLATRNDPPRPNPISPGDFVNLKRSRSFEQIAGFNRAVGQVNLTGRGESQQLSVLGVTRGFFDVLGVPPILGRPFDATDEAPGVRTLILNERTWRRQFGADAAVIGQTAVLDGDAWTIVGVMPEATTLGTVDTDAWLPHAVNEATARQTQSYYLVMVGRLRQGVSLDAANAELASLMRAVAVAYPRTNEFLSARAESLRERLTGPVRPALLLLLGGSGLVLLVAGINLVGLQLSWHLGRAQELVVRRALGASRGRIVRQLTTESVLLCVLGGATGLAVAAATLRGLSTLAPPIAWHQVSPTLTPSVVLYSAAITLAAGLIIGLWSSLSAASASDASPSAARGATMSRSAARTRTGVLAAQVAMAVVLLITATLTGASLLKVLRVDPGFTFDQGLVADVRATGSIASPISFFETLVDQTGALPGVRVACAISEVPLNSDGDWMTYIGEHAPAGQLSVQAAAIGMTDGCFDALEIPLITGRRFTRRETEGVAILSASVARDLWPGQTDVLDRRIHLGLRTGPLLRVVGIVPDIRLGSLETLERGQVWTPSSRGWPQPQRLMLRTDVPPASLVRPVRDVLNRLAPELALANVRTTDDIVVSATASRRFMLVLLGSFAVIAVVLCAVGIYGVLAHQVGQRTREIGIRMALGAGSASVLRFVVRLVLTGVLAGVTAGMAGAWALSSVLASQLFEMSATDPRVYGAVAGLVLLVAVLAALPPTRRAINIEPLNALRTF